MLDSISKPIITAASQSREPVARSAYLSVIAVRAIYQRNIAIQQGAVSRLVGLWPGRPVVEVLLAP